MHDFPDGLSYTEQLHICYVQPQICSAPENMKHITITKEKYIHWTNLKFTWKNRCADILIFIYKMVSFFPLTIILQN
uniref:Uncharacterized protein n=1 Tax=Anopheles christyi TaxID=43041 RepID=A0A182K2Z2_9DIPT